MNRTHHEIAQHDRLVDDAQDLERFAKAACVHLTFEDLIDDDKAEWTLRFASWTENVPDKLEELAGLVRHAMRRVRG